jgi:hypothetical protein
MKVLCQNVILFLILTTSVCFFTACQPVENNTNTNANGYNSNSNLKINGNINSNNSNLENTNSMSNSVSDIDTKEPDQYQATVTLKFEMTGSNPSATPPLKAEVARNGTDRRMEFAVPGGEKIIYLTKDGKQYLISPTRKQIAELNKEALGFEVRNLMMPEQVVNQVKNLKGVEKVGEEKVDGRDAVKYRYGATTDTQTKAGNVSTESFILVDKETGLPLRSVTDAVSDSANVQGIKGLKFITEMNNIKETAEPSLFEKPTDYKVVQPEEIRQQVNTIFNAAIAIFSQLLKSAQPNPSPVASPTSGKF